MQKIPKMYAVLFNAVTDALREMDQLNFGRASQILRAAQIEAEEQYICGEDSAAEKPNA